MGVNSSVNENYRPRFGNHSEEDCDGVKTPFDCSFETFGFGNNSGPSMTSGFEFNAAAATDQ